LGFPRLKQFKTKQFFIIKLKVVGIRFELLISGLRLIAFLPLGSNGKTQMQTDTTNNRSVGMGAPSWVYMRRIEHEQAAHSNDVSNLNSRIAELQKENEALRKKIKELEDENLRLRCGYMQSAKA
jgi:hypothetical protein